MAATRVCAAGQGQDKGNAKLITSSQTGFKISFPSYFKCSLASESVPHLSQLYTHSGLYTLLLWSHLWYSTENLFCFGVLPASLDLFLATPHHCTGH